MKKTVKLNNLTCGNCSSKIERAIKKIAGVNDANINFMFQKLEIDLEESKLDQILGEVEKIVNKYEPEVVCSY